VGAGVVNACHSPITVIPSRLVVLDGELAVPSRLAVPAIRLAGSNSPSRVDPSGPAWVSGVEDRVRRGRRLRTPPDPEGSNGKEPLLGVVGELGLSWLPSMVFGGRFDRGCTTNLTHDPSPASEVRELLARFNLRVRKSLGQNFLIDTAALDRITAAAALTPADTVLEIGPGLGTLTRRLAQAAGRVVAVEIDQNLIPPLRVALAAHPNVELIHGDILQLDPATLLTPHPTTRPPTLHPRQLQATPDRTGRGRVAGVEGRWQVARGKGATETYFLIA